LLRVYFIGCLSREEYLAYLTPLVFTVRGSGFGIYDLSVLEPNAQPDGNEYYGTGTPKLTKCLCYDRTTSRTTYTTNKLVTAFAEKVAPAYVPCGELDVKPILTSATGEAIVVGTLLWRRTGTRAQRWTGI